MRTLVLNAGYEPLAVVSFRRALVLVLAGKATVIADGGNPVVGGTLTLPRPSVILLARYVRAPHGRAVPVSRRGVLRRDGHRCAYCAVTPPPSTMSSRAAAAAGTPGRTSSPAVCGATTRRATGRRRRRAGPCASPRTLRVVRPGSCAAPTSVTPRGRSTSVRSLPEPLLGDRRWPANWCTGARGAGACTSVPQRRRLAKTDNCQ